MRPLLVSEPDPSSIEFCVLKRGPARWLPAGIVGLPEFVPELVGGGNDVVRCGTFFFLDVALSELTCLEVPKLLVSGFVLSSLLLSLAIETTCMTLRALTTVKPPCFRHEVEGHEKRT